MTKHLNALLLCIVFFVISAAQPPCEGSPPRFKHDVFELSVQHQYDAVRPGSKSALALHFSLKKDWHFYASAKTAPGGMNLKIKPSAKEAVSFSGPVLPRQHMYFDKASGMRLEVFSDDFTVYIPYAAASTAGGKYTIEIAFAGAVCSQERCRLFDERIVARINIDSAADMAAPKFSVPSPEQTVSEETSAGQWGNLSVWFALGLAFLAGLSLNIMPCVWPVLPLIVMRIIEQAKQTKTRSPAMGLAFCIGILLFFAVLAGANVILQLFYGSVLQWGDQFRNPAFVAAMALLLVVLALFMFGVFTITVPSVVSGKAGAGKGYTGAVGMGFLAAVLSTPCSFAILATAFAWAQAQRLGLATVAIMVIGVGMALPYAILTSVPGLLKRTPRPGRWMELVKQTIGFVLLIIAVKLIAALPQVRRMDVLYFAVVFSFCIWMWAGWVDFRTKLARKLIVRIIAVVLALAGGWVFLRPPAEELIDWQKYDAAEIAAALAKPQPVLIKFTADWCLSCQVVEKTVYVKKDIAGLIEDRGVLAIKADTTVKDFPATLDLKNLYNEPGVPVSMLFIPGRAEPLRWRGLAFGDELKINLQELTVP